MVYVYNASYEQSSYGIRVLYTLVESLNKQGNARAKIVCWEPYSQETANKIPQKYQSAVLFENFNFQSKDVKEDDVVVYPEIISGNPLAAKRVVRYLLNRPYYLNKKGIEYGETDFLMSYSKIIDDNLPQLFLLNDERYFYNEKNTITQKNQVALYFGKINPNLLLAKFKEIKRLLNLFENVVIITRSYPSSKLELIKILKSSRLLVSFDPVSNLSYEATLCGTPALVFDKSFSDTSKKFNLPLYGVMDDILQWPEAAQEVSNALATYEEKLEHQDAEVNKMFENIDFHFRKVEESCGGGYFERNKLLNRLQFELDLARARMEMDSRQLTNVYRLEQIPKKIRQVVLKKAAKADLKALIAEGKKTQNLKTLVKTIVKFIYRKLKKLVKRNFEPHTEINSDPSARLEITKEQFMTLNAISPVDRLRIKYAVFRGYPVELVSDLMAVDSDQVKKLMKDEKFKVKAQEIFDQSSRILNIIDTFEANYRLDNLSEKFPQFRRMKLLDNI